MPGWMSSATTTTTTTTITTTTTTKERFLHPPRKRMNEAVALLITLHKKEKRGHTQIKFFDILILTF